jgi:hypothetical protein
MKIPRNTNGIGVLFAPLYWFLPSDGAAPASEQEVGPMEKGIVTLYRGGPTKPVHPGSTRAQQCWTPP